MAGAGLILAAPASGSGKTLVAAGLLRALRNRGIRVAAAKAGPDYIDPTFLTLASGLITEGFDVCYSYRPLHLQGVGHAFLNSIAYLDYHRKGFDHPLVCFSVNCYGRRVISFRGGSAKFGQTPPPDCLPSFCSGSLRQLPHDARWGAAAPEGKGVRSSR